LIDQRLTGHFEDPPQGSLSTFPAVDVSREASPTVAAFDQSIGSTALGRPIPEGHGQPR